MSNHNSGDATQRARDNNQGRLLTIFAAIAVFIFLISFNPTRTGWSMTAVILPTAHAQEWEEAGGDEEADEEVSEPSLTTEDDDRETEVGTEEMLSAPETEERVYEVEPQIARMPAYEPSVTTEEDDPEEPPAESTDPAELPSPPQIGE